jgi:hypothetical protein
MRRAGFWSLLALAIVLGLLIAWVDSRPTWDDTGITIGTILILTGLLGLAIPKYAWLWALAVGLWIPLIEIPPHWVFAPLVALAVAFVGAYLGAFGRRGIDALIRSGLA